MLSKTNNTDKNSNNLKYNTITRNELLKKWDKNIMKSYILGYREFIASNRLFSYVFDVTVGCKPLHSDKRMNA